MADQVGSISADVFIPITSNVQDPINDKKVYAGLALTSNILVPTGNPIAQFSSSDDVGDFFGLESNEYAGSLIYFGSYQNSRSRPPYIYFGRYLPEDSYPYLKSGAVSDPISKLAELKLVTAGVITILVDGVSYTSTAINLSSATSLTQAAILLTEKLTDDHPALIDLTFDIAYNGAGKYFITSTGEVGASATIGYFSSTTTSLASKFLSTQDTGAILSQGANAQTVEECLENLLPYFTDQFNIFFTDGLGGSLTDIENLSLAKWVNDQGIPTPRFNSIVWSNEIALESDTDTTSIKYKIDQAKYNYCSVIDEVGFNNAQTAFFYSGIAASVDYSVPGSAFTLAFKTNNFLQPRVISTKVSKILNAKGINYYGRISVNGGPQKFNFLYGGYATGLWEYTDNIMAQVWINFQIQLNLLTIFLNTPQIGSDNDGNSKIKAAILQAVQSSLDNGIIAVGVGFDSIEQLDIRTNYGVDPSELTNNGYIILRDADTSFLRKNRMSAKWSLLYVKKSAIQYVPINTDTYF